MPKMSEKVKKTFDKYDNYIMNLDNRISRLILKHYVAYKFDYLNFVEIIAKKNSLDILLDIPADQLIDTKELAENISQKGSWGIGDVRIKVKDLDDFDYICGLIKQSLNNEMFAD